MEDKDILQKINNMAMSLEVPEELSQENISKKLPPIIYPEQVRKQRNKNYYKNAIKWTAAVVGPIAAAVILMVVCLKTVGIMGIKHGENGFYADHSILGTVKAENGFYTLKSYDSLKLLMERQTTANGINDIVSLEFLKRFSFGVAKEESNGELRGDGGAPGSYVDTELRTEGVKEGDITVTNGKYIFAYGDSDDYCDRYVRIIVPEGESTKQVGKIDIGTYAGQFSFGEMYIYDDMLIVAGYETEYIETKVSEWSSVVESINKTKIIFFNVEDVENPQHISTLDMDGYYESSRIKDGYLYIFSSVRYTEDDADICPEVNGQIIPNENVYIGNIFSKNSGRSVSIAYKIMASVSLENVTEFVSSIAVVSNDSQEYYVSTEHIYMYFQISPWLVCSCQRAMYSPDELGNAHIMKISYDDGKIMPAGTVTVDGEIDDTYCIDEYNGYLRLVVTVYNKSDKTSNSLYIFDENLEIVSSLGNIAEGEVTSSALFLGDIVYFVTHVRRTDPLFSVDVSDPKNPVILGALKLPGYTDYMRKWNDDLLLGFGYNEGTSEKLTLFDVSNPANLKEISTVDSDGEYVYYYMQPENYKAKLISPEKNVIGFYAFKMPKDGYVDGNYVPSYEIYCIDENNTLQLKESIRLHDNLDYWDYEEYAYYVRGIYIDDYIYVVVPGRQVIVYDVLQDVIIADIDL
ncbi:MAG: hypothetical protein E7266_08390 [Lachnospiraceae bacterium]|nr:hypothetical protein [Lachnospiraceae bacterium]